MLVATAASPAKHVYDHRILLSGRPTRVRRSILLLCGRHFQTIYVQNKDKSIKEHCSEMSTLFDAATDAEWLR